MKMLRRMEDTFRLSDKDEEELREDLEKLREEYRVKAEDFVASFATLSIMYVVVKEFLITKFMKDFGLNDATLKFLDSSEVQIDALSMMPMIVLISLVGGVVAVIFYEGLRCAVKKRRLSICMRSILCVLLSVLLVKTICKWLEADSMDGIFSSCLCAFLVTFLLSVKGSILIRYTLASSCIMFCFAVFLVSGGDGNREWSEQKRIDRQSGMVEIHQGENVFEARILAYQKDVIYLEQNGREIVVPLGSIQKIDCGIRE
ncbi:hypothetical protein ACI3L3_03465 [Desulfobaculum sp. SPO524]|uniref:hypothetical protein n=1 Tax=Desulfobaculum sp. SPO524 TaxID=3378071 RepID=UPI00385527F1